MDPELDRTALPLSSESVLDLQVDLGTVESAVAFVDLVTALAVFLVEDLLQNRFRVVPELDVTHEVLRSCGELCSVGDAEGLVDLVRDAEDIVDLSLDHVLCDKGVIVVLTEFLHSEKSVQLTGLLLSVEHVILGIADRQFLVGAGLSAELHHRVGAVHGLGSHGVHRLDGVFLILVLAGDDEHIIYIMCPVAADDPKLIVVDDRCGDLLILVQILHVSGVLHQCLVQLPH